MIITGLLTIITLQGYKYKHLRAHLDSHIVPASVHMSRCSLIVYNTSSRAKGKHTRDLRHRCVLSPPFIVIVVVADIQVSVDVEVC